MSTSLGRNILEMWIVKIIKRTTKNCVMCVLQSFCLPMINRHHTSSHTFSWHQRAACPPSLTDEQAGGILQDQRGPCEKTSSRSLVETIGVMTWILSKMASAYPKETAMDTPPTLIWSVREVHIIYPSQCHSGWLNPILFGETSTMMMSNLQLVLMMAVHIPIFLAYINSFVVV